MAEAMVAVSVLTLMVEEPTSWAVMVMPTMPTAAPLTVLEELYSVPAAIDGVLQIFAGVEAAGEEAGGGEEISFGVAEVMPTSPVVSLTRENLWLTES